MAYELIAPSDEEEEERIPQVTVATDIWAFGMTVLEVFSSLNHSYRDGLIRARLISDLERGVTIFPAQARHGCYPLCHERRPTKI
jgi:hypothetical protein